MVNKPKPNELKRLEGNPGKRPIKDTIKPAIGMLTCPRWLLPPARKEWHKIVPELQILGLLTKIDHAALEAYCQSYGRWVEAEKVLKVKGPLYKTESGNVITSPMLWVANKEREFLNKFLTEFGMTPSSRTRLSTASGKDENDPLEDLLSGNRVN